jgi:hypothetical protein
MRILPHSYVDVEENAFTNCITAADTRHSILSDRVDAASAVTEQMWGNVIFVRFLFAYLIFCFCVHVPLTLKPWGMDTSIVHDGHMDYDRGVGVETNRDHVNVVIRSGGKWVGSQ